MMGDFCYIFTAAMSSSYPPSFKKDIATRYKTAATENLLLERSQQMMECTMHLVLSSEDTLVVELSWNVFDAWSTNYDHFESFFSTKKISTLLQNVFQNPANVVAVIARVLERIKSTNNCHYEDLCSTCAINIAGFVEHNPRYDALSKLCVLILAFPEVLPKDERLSYFCMSLIKSISQFKPPGRAIDVIDYIAAVPMVFSPLLAYSWKIGGYNLCRLCLETVFELISAPINEDRTVSLALGAVVNIFPGALMESSMEEIAHDTLVSDNTLFNTLRHMINWLAWPNIKIISIWTNCFLDCLDMAERYDLLDRITIESVPKLVDRLKSRNMRKSNFEVLEFLLKRYQRSEIPFHAILEKVGAVYSSVMTESTVESKEFLSHFSELLRFLVRLHRRPADSYEPILKLIGTEAVPDDVFEAFKALAWMKKRIVQKTSSALMTKKSFTEKTGLQNDHNTCFLNSVIQAFYMCDSLVEQLLTTKFPRNAVTLASVQLLFAFLRFSKRLSIKCDWFEKEAAPSSFVRGNQEDASELFNHLVDLLMEQEKLLPTEHFIFESFYGLQNCISRCLSCGNEVSRRIPYAELSLHFKNGATSKRITAGLSTVSSSENSDDARCLLLEDMLSHYFEKEQLEGDCRYSCENCQSDQNGEKFVLISDSPKFLRITLNRFTYSDLVSCKIMTEVNIPRTVVLPVQREDSQLTDVFCLFAVIVHCGRNTNSGHYYCIARHPRIFDRTMVAELDVSTLDRNTDFFVDRWLKFDDETISKSSFDELSSRFGRTPYILLYRKVTDGIFISGETSLCNLEARVPPDVMKEVETDNQKYLMEIESRNRLFSTHGVKPSKSNRWNNDDDDDGGPQPSNKFDEIPRMVY